MVNENNTNESMDNTTKLRKAIGLQLKALRLSHGNMSQKVLAERIGCSLNAVSQIEIGNQSITFDQIKFICGELGAEPNYFFIGSMPELEYKRPLELFQNIFPDLKPADQLLILDMLEFFWGKDHPDASYEERLHKIPGWKEIFQLIEDTKKMMHEKGLKPSADNKFYLYYRNASKENS